MLQRFQRIRETDMKKLILITGILLSTSLWASPMDTICRVDAGESGYDADEFIFNNSRIVERSGNNILILHYFFSTEF